MLEGLLVLELASVLAGPSVGQFLAELGARVIKVENPHTGGDVTRSWHRVSENPAETASYFACCNFGKESLALDLASEPGRAAVRRLIARADVLLTSFAPGSDARLGLTPEEVRAISPTVIHAAISGYGSKSSRPGYDAVIQAESGFMSINGYPDGPPTKLPVALMDLLAAHHLKEAVLVALLRRERTGEGTSLEVSLLDAALSSLANQASGWFATGETPSRKGSGHPNIAPYGTVLHTADGVEVLLAVGTDRQFAALCGILGLDLPADDPRFATNAARVRNRDVLERALREAGRTLTGARLLAALEREGVPAGAIRSVSEALVSKNAVRLRLEDASGTDGLRQWLPGNGTLSPPPGFGQHSRRILREVGAMDDHDIDTLIQTGVVVDGS